MGIEMEKLSRSFKRAWMGLIIAGAMILFSDNLNRIEVISSVPFSMIGAFSLLSFGIRLNYIDKKMKQNPKLLEVLKNDEYRQHLVLKSYRVSYGVLCAVIMLLLVCRDFSSLSAEVAMKIIFIAVFAMPHFVLWVLDREA